VIGFVLTSNDPSIRPMYVTGDSRFKVGVVLLFAGAAQTRGPFFLTMNTNDAIETAQAFSEALIVPVPSENSIRPRFAS
jgi:hypothetical protein